MNAVIVAILLAGVSVNGIVITKDTKPSQITKAQKFPHRAELEKQVAEICANGSKPGGVVVTASISWAARGGPEMDAAIVSFQIGPDTVKMFFMYDQKTWSVFPDTF